MERHFFKVAAIAAIAVATGGACADETTPIVDTPDTFEVEVTPPAPIIDLVVDTNRDGVASIDDAADEEGEDDWTAAHGAIFLANIDDDEDACPTVGSDITLAECFDAADDIVNGESDLLDMAAMKIAPWPDAPDDASGQLVFDAAAAANTRVFMLRPSGDYLLFNPLAERLSATELRAGVEFRIEGKDIVRSVAVWDGRVRFELEVSDADGVLGTDSVSLRVAPVLLYNHMEPLLTLYSTKFAFKSSTDFVGDLEGALTSAGIEAPLFPFFVSDQWAQDFLEPGYMTAPGPNGTQHVIRVNLRSANTQKPNDPDNPLRPAGKVIFNALRGPDMGAIQQFDRSHPGSMDSLDSFGNTETIPPYTHNGESYPLGRVFRGSIASFYPDPSFAEMMAGQAIQPLLAVDTSWLVVGHVDETISFVPTSKNERGWTIMVNDPQMAWKMLQDLSADGHGDVVMFEGMEWDEGVTAEITINDVLADSDLAAEVPIAAIEVDAQLEILMAATGITEDELIRIPYIHKREFGYHVAYQVGTVNGVSLNATNFASPNPHGPMIDGVDVMKKQFEEAVAPHDITVHWVEDWDLYHRLLGEVHCGTNSLRRVADARWWESGR